MRGKDFLRRGYNRYVGSDVRQLLGAYIDFDFKELNEEGQTIQNFYDS